MSLKDVLIKMKLVEADAKPAETGGAARAGETIGDILTSVPEVGAIDAAKLPETPPDGALYIPDFASIFKAAGVHDPPHGFTAYKVLEIVSSEGFASLDSKAKAAAVATFLKMNPGGAVAIKDVIQDAVQRDQALDKFEEFLQAKLAALAGEADKDSARLQAEIDELVTRNRGRMEANRKRLDDEQRRFAEWQARKRSEERKLADAVAPFVDQSPVTTGGKAKS